LALRTMAAQRSLPWLHLLGAAYYNYNYTDAPHLLHGHATYYMGTLLTTWARHLLHGHATYYMGTLLTRWARYSRHGQHGQAAEHARLLSAAEKRVGEVQTAREAEVAAAQSRFAELTSAMDDTRRKAVPHLEQSNPIPGPSPDRNPDPSPTPDPNPDPNPDPSPDPNPTP
jgi:hypothetical protein